MDKKYCIFDMDGTLVDSMGYWRSLGREYLAEQGFTGELVTRTLEKLRALTMLEGADLFRRTFDLPGTPRDIADEMNDMMQAHYRRDVQLKPGAAEYLRMLRKRGCRLCVATATDEALAHICFRRLGIDDCFEFVLSCSTLGVRKTQPDIYYAAARQLGCRPEDAAVFEDALHAAQTAKAAGFYTVVVEDENQRDDWTELTALADEIVTDWRSALS